MTITFTLLMRTFRQYITVQTRTNGSDRCLTLRSKQTRVKVSLYPFVAYRKRFQSREDEKVQNKEKRGMSLKKYNQ